VLELPADHKPGDPALPMIVEIHGGPTAATQFRLDAGIYGRTFLPAKGYAVLSPNYRGSTGYGDAFLVDLVGRENDIEVKDILAGVDAMVARGIADPARLGVMGWSNGGFLTNALITQTNRFKAASSGAGVVDQVIQWATEDTPGHVINYNKAAQPWADPTVYRAQSPLYQLGRVVTPTLIHVGENDERVPAAHARGLYRGLKFYVQVPTELVVYPGEGHGLTTYQHRKAKMEWDHAWFDRYVLGKREEKSEKPKP
jgi:dipeptidyl aminopeptidase/acylaminoacyl peptidase